MFDIVHCLFQVRAYARDWSVRGIVLADLQFSARGHTPGKRQEVLLFPPSYVPHGASAVPEEAFMHLLLWVTQNVHKIPLDPSSEGRVAAATALAAYLA